MIIKLKPRRGERGNEASRYKECAIKNVLSVQIHNSST